MSVDKRMKLESSTSQDVVMSLFIRLQRPCVPLCLYVPFLKASIALELYPAAKLLARKAPGCITSFHLALARRKKNQFYRPR